MVVCSPWIYTSILAAEFQETGRISENSPAIQPTEAESQANRQIASFLLIVTGWRKMRNSSEKQWTNA
jgi:hypothetical protein